MPIRTQKWHIQLFTIAAVAICSLALSLKRTIAVTYLVCCYGIITLYSVRENTSEYNTCSSKNVCIQSAEGERSVTLCNSCYNKTPVIGESLHTHVHFYVYTKQQQCVCHKKINKSEGDTARSIIS